MHRWVALLSSVLVLEGCAAWLPMRAEDRALLMPSGWLSELGYAAGDDARRYEAVARVTEFDGTVRLSYRFRPPASSAWPSLDYDVAIHPFRSYACTDRADMRTRYETALPQAGLDEIEPIEGFEYGDESSLEVFRSEGQPRGNLFTMCRSRMSASASLVGRAVDAAAFERLIRPPLEALERYEVRAFPDQVEFP